MGLQQSVLSEKIPSVICSFEFLFILFESIFNHFGGLISIPVKAAAVKFVRQKDKDPWK